jgi:hypothetical protein
MLNLSMMNHPNLVVVHYNSYAGGKFWINCLSHHAQAIPGLHVSGSQYDSDLWMLDQLDPQEIQRRKIIRINSTLPLPTRMKEWCQFELGCIQFWGNKLDRLLESNHTVPDTAIQLLNQYRCFIVNHRPQTNDIKKIFDIFPRAKHILLNNADRFQQNSMVKKQSNPWPMRYDTSTDIDMFTVDVDNTYMNIDLSIERVKDCLGYLGLSTELDPNIHGFVKRYFDLHE